jgi:membrane protease YdiL (CAAX protease family)
MADSNTKKNRLTFWEKTKRFFSEPFQKEGVLPEVPWSAKDGLMVILVSTILFSIIVFTGFFMGGWLIDKGFVAVPGTLDDLGLSISTQEAIEMGIFNGFDVMSLLLLDHFSFLVTMGILIQVGLQIFLLFFYSRFKYGVHATEFGFRSLPIKMLLWMVLLLFVLSVLIQNGYLQLVALLGIENAHENGGAEQLIMDGMIPLPILFLFAGVAAPILEEVIFRGFFLAGSLKKNAAITALVFSAIFFALAHMDPSIFFPSFDGTGIRFTIPTMAEIISTFILMPIYFALGMLLGFAFLRTKSLYPGIVFHMVNNNAALILLLMSLKNNS